METKFDKNNNLTYIKYASGVEYWYEYDENNNLLYYRDSRGFDSRLKAQELKEKNNLQNHLTSTQ